VLYASERLWSQGLIFKLVLVGNRSWSDQDEQNYLNSLVARGRDIERHFEVSDSELVDFYRTSDVLVFPSLHEGFGLPIIEALSHGLPVITSEFGSMGQLACHGGCITVDPNDDQAFELSLKNVLTDSSLRKSLMNQASTTSHLTSHDFVNRIREGLQLKTYP
jgi:glycosyltransferase involved in cell wall biosynthesis